MRFERRSAAAGVGDVLVSSSARARVGEDRWSLHLAARYALRVQPVLSDLRVHTLSRRRRPATKREARELWGHPC